MNKLEKNMPEKTFRSGVVCATIWHNIGKNTEGIDTNFKSVSFQRRYCDKEGEWKSTRTLRIGDLPKAAMVLREAYKYLSLNEKECCV